VAYTVVALDCTGGLLTRYPTADSVVDMDSTSASVEYKKAQLTQRERATAVHV